MVINKRTLIVVGSSTAIGFLGDVLTYSVAAKKDGAFKVVIPKGKDLISVLVLGIIGGFVIDYALKQIEESLKTAQEKALDELVSTEKEKIELQEGGFANKKPTSIIWV
jgi:thiamine pyrophosphokinase